MQKAQCKEQGHYYDASKYESCPHCNDENSKQSASSFVCYSYEAHSFIIKSMDDIRTDTTQEIEISSVPLQMFDPMATQLIDDDKTEYSESQMPQLTDDNKTEYVDTEFAENSSAQAGLYAQEDPDDVVTAYMPIATSEEEDPDDVVTAYMPIATSEEDPDDVVTTYIQSNDSDEEIDPDDVVTAQIFR